MPVTFTESVTTSAGTVTTSTTLTPADEGLTVATVAVANGQTDKAISIGGVDVSQTVGIYIKSTAAVTLETNANDATGGNTLVLAANIPYVWYTGKEDASIFTEDIETTIYATNASGSAASINFVFVQDSTP
jgi:hypothetical protein